jgi:hypothetical protein
MHFHSPVASSSAHVSRTVVTFEPYHSTEDYAKQVAEAVSTKAFELGVDSFDVVALPDRDGRVQVGVELTGDLQQIRQARQELEGALRAQDEQRSLKGFDDHEWFKR